MRKDEITRSVSIAKERQEVPGLSPRALQQFSLRGGEEAVKETEKGQLVRQEDPRRVCTLNTVGGSVSRR